MVINNLQPITVSVTVHASMDAVWNYWTHPDHITNWNFAGDAWCCPTATNDLQPTEHFSFRMESKDGSMGFDFIGTYKTVQKHKLITYKIEDGRLVTIDFIPNGNEVIVKQIFDAEGTHTDQQQRDGWQAILDNFKKYAESLGN